MLKLYIPIMRSFECLDSKMEKLSYQGSQDWYLVELSSFKSKIKFYS